MDGRRRVTVLSLLLPILFVTATAWAADDAQSRLDEIRGRLRAEAGVSEGAARDADLPMVALTILPGDTHARLAADLTGSRDAERVLRKIQSELHPGDRIYVPRAMLLPRLADPRLQGVPLGGAYPTLWSLTKGATVTDGLGVAASVRNLQRLNAIVDPTHLHRGARILVPRSLVAGGHSRKPAVALHTEYRATDLSGLERRPSAYDYPRALRRRLRREGVWARQLKPRKVDLIVVHTTEHRGAPFENVARYLQRKRLANYLIGPDGAAYVIVPESHRAYGCGQSLWEGWYGVDYEAVNIEVFADTAPGTKGHGIAPAQYEGLKRLLAYIQARHPGIHDGRVVTHRMVAVSYAYGTRSRKGDPYEFDWSKAGLPDNSQFIDQDVLLGRAKLCTDERYADRVTEGQTAAARMLHAL